MMEISMTRAKNIAGFRRHHHHGMGGRSLF